MLAGVVALPLVAFLILMLWGCRLHNVLVGVIGVGSIVLSLLLTVAILNFSSYDFLLGEYYQETLWSWIPPMNIAFRLDKLSIIMTLVITSVASLVSLYSMKFMANDPGFARFFACINLFVFAMLVLVLADNLLLLFVGWEGVGLCSYLLIGFWYQDNSACAAANKAFITTRIGDVFLLLGMALLFASLGTLNIADMLAQSSIRWPKDSLLPTLAGFLMLAGAVGKSAQFPLQTWLPDAMKGPTPVSALIHAATMVTAGVYLLARTSPLLANSSLAQEAVLFVGAITMLMGSFSALAQSDLKRALAYSTMSQIGMMLMAIGLNSPSAAMFHFMTHAFFKALLFLCAGVVGEAMHHEYNMSKLGGLRHSMPFTFICFVIGCSSLAGLPFVTAGFFSKDQILKSAFAAQNPIWWMILLLGVFLTALYSFRIIAMVFLGKAGHSPSYSPGWMMYVPLTILSFLSIASGYIERPLLRFLGKGHDNIGASIILMASVASVFGIILSLVIYRGKARNYELPLFRIGFGFDALYQAVLVKPYIRFAAFAHNDAFVVIYTMLSHLTYSLNRLITLSQSGRIGQYLVVLVASAIAVMGIMVIS
jgi:NADH-quinone oxidoreductase subunit L